MATFNGELYVADQVRSILAELNAFDEVVIVDDASTDRTVDILNELGDARLRLLVGRENRGYVRSFERAVSLSRGEFVLLADQDDIWLPGRVDAMLDVLRSEAVVASNMTILGTGERPNWWMPASQAAQWRRNIVRILAGVSGYYGCGMGFRRSFVSRILPFPSFLHESHDLWIAIAGNVAHSIGLVEEPTLQRRVHSENVTPTRPRRLGRVLAARVMLIRCLLVSYRRDLRARRAGPKR